MSLLSAVLQEADKTSSEDFKKHRDELLPKIKDLTERVQMLSWALQQNFMDNYYNFTITKSLEQLNYKNRRGNIDSDYTKYSETIKTLKEKLVVTDEEFNSYYDKLCEFYVKFQDLCIVVEGKSVLERANHEFGRFNYSEAMVAVSGLKKQLNNLNFEGNMAKALLNLFSQAENQLALYTAQLSIEWEDIFTWAEKKALNSLTYSLTVEQSDSILIQKVLSTLYVTERMNAEFGMFSYFFINQLLHNVIRHNCDIYTDEHIGAIIFNIKIDLNDTNKPNYQTIFNNLTAVFEFLQSTLGSHFSADRTFIEVFSETIKQKFFNKIIDDCIRINLPSCKSSYQNYKNIVIELDAFNKFLIDLKFVKAEESPLNKYIDDTECVLYNKKCDKLLADVRNLLTESISYGTVVVGTSAPNDNESILDVTDKDVLWDLNRPIFLPKCVISENVKKILTLIVDHLEESAKLPEKYSNQLVSYIKDIAVMYQCIVPKKFKVNLECCPSDIALFFNNCFYLAHGLLGPPWCNSLPHNLAEQLTIVLLESIQDLRVLGLEKISLYLQNKKSIIIQSIECKEPSLWTHDTYEKVDCAVNNALTLMKDLRNCWYNILPARMYEMSICTLIQVLCQSVLDRVFVDSRPISENLVYMLATLVDDIIAEIETLFEALKRLDRFEKLFHHQKATLSLMNIGYILSREKEPFALDSKIDVWLKFTKLPQLLKAQLLEISELWNKDKEQFQGYTCEEVRQIVKMRFPDDKYRLRILKEIQ